MKDVIKMALKLFLITLVAGGLLGATYAVTAEPIAEQQRLEAETARKAVLSEATTFEAIEDISEILADPNFAMVTAVYTGTDESGNTVGYVVEIITKGYSAGLNMSVGIKADGTVSGMKVGTHAETAGLGAKATEPWFEEQYVGKSAPLVVVKNVASAGETEILSIAGATITTDAITDAVNVASDCITQYVIGG